MDSRHFAAKLCGQSPVMQSLSGASTSPQITLAQARSFQSSSLSASPFQSGPNPLIQLPTLGNTGVKLNGSRWSGPGAAEGMSVFDTGAAMDLLRNGPEPADTRRMTSAAIAHANRIQRHAQMNATLHGFKLLPDLTPGRAFIWGSFLALWTVGTACMTTCRSLDIHSREEFPVKMKAAFQPVREWAQAHLAPVRERLTFEDQPLALTQLQNFGTTYRRRVSSGVPESELLASQ